MLFPPGVILSESTPLPDNVALFPAEAALIARAGPKRRREFSAGRQCARRALAQLGMPAQPIGAGADRAPLWPSGVVGSISHTDRYCVAVVAKRSAFAALGVDAEPDEPLEAELWPTVCTELERRWLDAQPEAARGRLARLMFSAKESAYKCQYSLTGEVLEFLDLDLSLDLAGGRFVATLQRSAGAQFVGGAIAGRFAIDRGLILTGAAIAA